jgi:hypothetical protein
MLSRILVASIMIVGCIPSARAATYEVTYTGSTYSPQSLNASFDSQNLFGGGNLANQAITVTFTYDTSLAAIQNNAVQGNNAISGAMTEVEINIGGITQTVSVPFLSSLVLNYNDNLSSSRAQAEALTSAFNINVQLAENIPGSAAGAFIPRSLTSPYSFTGAGGVGTGFFRFTNSAGDITQALFTPTQVFMSEAPVAPVPGPIVGAGLPGLVIAAGGLLVLRRRRNQTAVAWHLHHR